MKTAVALGVCLSFAIIAAGLTRMALAAEECCTPEATAKIAAKAGFVDVVGIKLGMPVKDAVAAVKQYNPKLQLYPQPTTKIDQFPGLGFSDGVNARTDNQSEAIELSVAMPPNQEVVWSVVRAITDSAASARGVAGQRYTSVRRIDSGAGELDAVVRGGTTAGPGSADESPGGQRSLTSQRASND